MGSKITDDHDDAIAEINVVPLVDIILVVLIIFMVTAPLVMKPSIDINLPKASSGKQQNVAKSLDIIISPEGVVMVDGKVQTIEQLGQLAKNAITAMPEVSAILTADKSVTLDKLTTIIDTVKTAGIKKVAFSIQKK